MLEIIIGAVCAVLLTVFIVQIGKARELASVVRGDKKEEYEVNTMQAALGMVFMVVFLLLCIWSFIVYTPTSLGWGPNTASSAHGSDIDYMFNLTLFFTAIVFFATQYLLFYYSWKYRGRKGHKAIYWAHNEKLEMVWMIIPAVVMTFLVVGGLNSWNMIMADVNEEEKLGEDYMEIEAKGFQFAWLLRYPGRDAQLGETDFTKIVQGANDMGQIWSDVRNVDDFAPDNIVLPVNKKVRVRITARDVLHNFYIRDMRVKMDAVPGMPTYFVFTPTVTTDSIRSRYSKYPEWQGKDKDGVPRYARYNYELACAELCGKSHFNMKKLVMILTQEKYEAWLDEQEGSYEVKVNKKDDGSFELIDVVGEENKDIKEQLKKKRRPHKTTFYNNVIATGNIEVRETKEDRDTMVYSDVIGERLDVLSRLILEKSKVNALWAYFEAGALAEVENIRNSKIDIRGFEKKAIKEYADVLKIARTTNDLNTAKENTNKAKQVISVLIADAEKLVEESKKDKKDNTAVAPQDIEAPQDSTLTSSTDSSAVEGGR
ncbi:MAG: cytochrome c oxidase subunit II [Saprospiraceae bacterium]|nr:cytochrome c oxidase subunit II [Saprospiraceae bacterium]